MMSVRGTGLSSLVWFLMASFPICAVAQMETAAGEEQVSPLPEASTTTTSAITESAADAGPRSQVRAGPPEDLEPIDLEKLAKARQLRAAQYPVNSRINRYLAAAIEAQDESTPAEGLALLERLNPKRLNPMERASLYRVEALLHYADGDLDSTIAGFRKMIDENIMPLSVDTSIRFNIAQLLAGLYRWDDAIAAIFEWFRYVREPEPIAYYLLGIANFQLGNSELAIANTEKALDLAPEPKEGWLQLLAALYIQKEDYANAAPILEELVTQFPKKAYWAQLSLIYGAREDYRASLAVQQVAYAQGLLSEDKELRRLARSYLYAELPYPAAKVLEKGIVEGVVQRESKSLELLANSWIAAREFEKSLPPLLEAAKVAVDGNLFVRVGQVYLQREQWGLAAKQFEGAIDKGDLKQPGNANLLLGIAYYNDEQFLRAKSSFIEAANHEKTRPQAERWITHLEKEASSG